MKKYTLPDHLLVLFFKTYYVLVANCLKMFKNYVHQFMILKVHCPAVFIANTDQAHLLIIFR